MLAALSWGACVQTASRRRRIARGSGRAEVDVTNMIGTFSGMRSKMQSMSKMMKMGSGGRLASHQVLAWLLKICPAHDVWHLPSCWDGL